MNSADVCNRAPMITAWGLGPAQGPQKLNDFKVCLVYSKPILELNSDLHWFAILSITEYNYTSTTFDNHYY